MRFVFIVLAASLTFAGACKKTGGGGGEVLTRTTELKNKACACKDKACVDQVSAEMTKWVSEQKPGEADKMSEADRKALTAVTDELTGCITKIAADAASAAAGSGSAGSGSAAEAGSAAGSGSDTGSAAMGSGAGSGSGSAAGEAMAHRAGMCPSTVLGATTKAAVKGKAVVVTVESADHDAIMAIQRRADELLAEKKAAPTGNAHDMKGTHGGGQGICPVYVPEGAKAVAKHQAKGVVVTITPKDKPDDLGKEIDGRIAKATEWVKANVKDADKGNQGGVGGGKGDDGSNHSGKGDSKGHDRKKGGGGGKGTGGGTGDGAGSAKAG